jgi:antitoxin HicB
MEYTALFEPTGSGAFVITFPDFGWGVSQGDDEEDARTMATALLQTLIQEHIRNGEPLPHPTKPRGRKYRVIRLQAMQDAKAELYRQFLASGLRKSELARRLDIPKTVVDRLFNLNHHSRLPHIEAAFRALGKELTIEVRDAA